MSPHMPPGETSPVWLGAPSNKVRWEGDLELAKLPKTMGGAAGSRRIVFSSRPESTMHIQFPGHGSYKTLRSRFEGRAWHIGTCDLCPTHGFPLESGFPQNAGLAWLVLAENDGALRQIHGDHGLAKALPQRLGRRLEEDNLPGKNVQKGCHTVGILHTEVR